MELREERMIKHNHSGWRIAAVSPKAPFLPRLRRRWMKWSDAPLRLTLLALLGCALLALVFVARPSFGANEGRPLRTQ